MSTPAGWYPQPDGQQRYWDGQQWTESFAPGAATPVTTPATGGELARLWPENEHVNRMSDQLTPAPQVVPVPVEVKGSNGLAVAGFVLALLGALSSFIPIVNIGGDFLALLGLIFGIIGLVQSGKRAAGKGLSIAAIILAVVAFVISIVVNTATVKAVNDAVKTFPTAPATPGAEATSSPAATEPTPTTPPASEHPGVGGTATINDSAGAGTITLNSIRRTTKAEGPLGGTPTNGSYLVANFTVTVTSGSFDVNPLFFKASSSDGRTFNSELGVLYKQIDSATLTAGRQVRGDVAFDAPVGSLLVDYGIFGPPLATFSFKG